MSEHTAYVIFLAVACGGLVLATIAMIAIAVALWRRNRQKPPR